MVGKTFRQLHFSHFTQGVERGRSWLSPIGHVWSKLPTSEDLIPLGRSTLDTNSSIPTKHDVDIPMKGSLPVTSGIAFGNRLVEQSDTLETPRTFE